MRLKIWIYGFNNYNERHAVGIIVAESGHTALSKIKEMYEDFNDEEMDNLIIWEMKEDDNYRSEYPGILEIIY